MALDPLEQRADPPARARRRSVHALAAATLTLLALAIAFAVAVALLSHATLAPSARGLARVETQAFAGSL
ncbi:MAG TPA: hypothetical protein VL977_06600, partial [Solirubrobacteraceae bacterium]|nr:hypothetical protein [Solirubrobacteraceae bacterium]